MKIEFLLILSISLILVYISYTDIRQRRIANHMTLLILCLSTISGCIGPAGPSITLALVLFFCGIILTSLGCIGAGDVKLMGALAVGIPVADIGNFLLLTSLSGIPLTLFTLLYYRFFFRHGEITIPYGVALSCGYWLRHFFSIY